MRASESQDAGTRTRRPAWALWRRRSCVVPTWRGWLTLAGLVAIVVFISVRAIHPFLAVNAPIESGVLVVEGWMPDFALEEAKMEFQQNGRVVLYVTGIPIEKGAPMSEFETYAELGAATLATLGLGANVVRAVPAPDVRQDRTFASAVALRDRLQAAGSVPASINVATLSAHARRTRLLFAKAFGGDTRIGIIALDDPRYDERRWWRTSDGFRTVIDEVVAYTYARFLFRARDSMADSR